MSDAKTITEQDVRHVAKLSRLWLSDEEVAMFAGQLNDVMGHINKLREVDIDGVEPMVHAYERTNVLRDDEPTPGLDVDQVLHNAPQRDDPFFRVPKVLGESGA